MVQMLASASTAVASGMVEVVDDFENDVSNYPKKLDEPDVGYIARRKQFEQTLEVQEEGGGKVNYV